MGRSLATVLLLEAGAGAKPENKYPAFKAPLRFSNRMPEKIIYTAIKNHGNRLIKEVSPGSIVSFFNDLPYSCPVYAFKIGMG